MQGFIQSLDKFGKGALLFPGAVGKWRQTREALLVYRKVIIPQRSTRQFIRDWIIDQLAAMNTALRKAKQETVVFSERRITWIVIGTQDAGRVKKS